MRTPRYVIRFLWAFLVRFRLILVMGFVVGLIAFVALEFLIPRLSQKNERIGIVGEYTSYQIPNSILGLIGTGLTEMAKDYQASDSGKTWTFHLKENLHWQDGTNVISDDINYSFSGVNVRRPDKYTIVFELSSPFAAFPATVSRPVFKKGFLGTGEWKVNGLSLANNFAETLTIENNNKDQKIFKFYPTEERAKLAYELGEIDSVQELSDAKPFDTWLTVKIDKTINKQRYVAVFFNTKDETLGDKDIRQALSYAIDKEAFGEDRALGPISPTSWAYNPQVKPYDFNIKRAKELMTKKDIKIKLTTVPGLLKTAEAIAANWKEIGVNTTLQVTSFVPDEYQAFLAIYDSPQDPDQYLTWHSTQTQTNISRYDNKRINKLLEDGRLETDQEKRKKIYLDFQRFLVEDAPAAFLYHPTYYTISRQ